MPKLDDCALVCVFVVMAIVRGKLRVWGVEMRRWGGRTSDVASFLEVAAEHRSREEADVTIVSIPLADGCSRSQNIFRK